MSPRQWKWYTKKKRKKAKQKSNKDGKEERGDVSYSERVKGES